MGTVRREFLDHILFWNARDLERKLAGFQRYYNGHRAHSSLGGDTPAEVGGFVSKPKTAPNDFHIGSPTVVACIRFLWRRRCQFARDRAVGE